MGRALAEMSEIWRLNLQSAYDSGIVTLVTRSLELLSAAARSTGKEQTSRIASQSPPVAWRGPSRTTRLVPRRQNG